MLYDLLFLEFCIISFSLDKLICNLYLFSITTIRKNDDTIMQMVAGRNGKDSKMMLLQVEPNYELQLPFTDVPFILGNSFRIHLSVQTFQ